MTLIIGPVSAFRGGLRTDDGQLLRVLLIDDDANDRELIAGMLRHLPGYEVIEASDYAAALAAIGSKRFDACITDFLLGTDNGLDLMSAVRSRGIDTPFLILTGLGDPAIDSGALAHGAADFLLKNELDSASLDRSIRYSVRHAEDLRRIRESEDLFVSTFDSLQTMLAIVAGDGKIIAVNRAWGASAAQAGFRSESLGTGANYLDVLRKAVASGDPDSQIVLDGIAGVLAGTRQEFTHEYWCDGENSRLWFSMRVTPFRRRGEPHAVVAHEDITERHLSDQALQRSRERLTRAQEIAGLGNWECNLATGEYTWSDQLLRMLGVADSALTRIPGWMDRFLPPHDVERVRAARESAIASRKPCRLTHRLVLADGSWRHVEQRLEFLAGENGHAGRVCGTLQDITELRNAQDTVIRNEQLFRAMTEHSTNATALLDARGRFTFVTRTTQALFGCGEQELVGKGASALVPGPDNHRIRRAFVHVLRCQGSSVTLEHRITRSDGSWRLCETVLTNLLHEPDIQSVVWNARDITDRYLAEQALRRSLARYRRLSESGLVGIFEGEPGRPLSYANARFLEMVGYSTEDLNQGRITWRSISMPEFDCPDEDTRTILQHDGRLGPAHRELRRSDGSGIAVLTGSALLERGSSSVIGLAIDMTEQARIRRQLQRTERSYRTLFANANDWVFTVDRAGVLTSCNEAGQRITGYSAEELTGNPIDHLLGLPEGRLAEIFRSCRSESGAYHAHECTVTGKDGRHIVLEISAQPIAEGGDHAGWQAIARDITERRSLEQQLRQSQKMEAIGRLAGGIAHDFNNILTVVLGHSATLSERVPESDPIHSQVTAINDAGMRAATLTRQLLTFSRRHVLKTGPLDVSETVAQMQHMLRRVIGEQYELSCALNGAGWTKADTSQIEQVLLNLVVNARDAMPNGGRIRVSTSTVHVTRELARLIDVRHTGSYVTLSVADDGTGMDDSVRQRIFEPFFTTKEVGKGTGLGLSTVYGIVKQLGGGIDVQTEPNEGSVFTIYLPVSDEAPTPRQQRTAVPGIRPGATVLLVEDEEAVRSYLKSLLTRAGFQVTAAASGHAALTEAERMSRPPDVVVSDVVMPRMPGPQLIRELRARWPELRCLLISGYNENLTNDLLPGVVLMSKPFSPDDLLLQLSKLMDPQQVRRVLIVDDDPAMRRLIRMWLEGASFEVTEAGNGREALSEVRRNKPDLVITDLVMPEQEGLETIPVLRSEFPDVLVIAVSGAFHGEMLRVAGRLGAHAVLPKPLTERDLLQAVHAVDGRGR